MLPEKLHKKLKKRIENNALRTLSSSKGLVDFSSNDYMGFAKSKFIYQHANGLLDLDDTALNGATGSRLLTGNHKLYKKVENTLCNFHKSEAALFFNSGYDANIGFFSSVPQRGDVILYDANIHASIRDGIQMSLAKSYKFKHNDLQDLVCAIKRCREACESCTIYVVTESVFSMDGDTPELTSLAAICSNYNCLLIVDEAHAIGVFKEGLIKELALETSVFARIVTFGKAIGAHGAAVLGNTSLITYLINFARSFIYTTALPPHSLATVQAAYELLISSQNQEIHKLHHNIKFFKKNVMLLGLDSIFIESHSAIQSCIITGNKEVRKVAVELFKSGFDVKPILSPTVAKGEERLRFCLHSFNSEKEIEAVLKHLSTFASFKII